MKTVRDFLEDWPANRKISIYDIAGGKEKHLYCGIAGGVPFCLKGYEIKRIGAQPNYKITLYINTRQDMQNES